MFHNMAVNLLSAALCIIAIQMNWMAVQWPYSQLSPEKLTVHVVGFTLIGIQSFIDINNITKYFLKIFQASGNS